MYFYQVPLCRPSDYVELVKNVGVALRALMGSVDVLLKDLPEQVHQEVSEGSHHPTPLVVAGWR